jgi:transposase
VIQHRRKKYACKACEGKIQVAVLPLQPIPKSNASPGLLAHIAVAKYQDGLALFRMETIFSRLGIHLPRSTMANWMIKCSELLQPLYNLLNDQLLASGYVHMDETPVQVLKEPDKSPESKSYMWVRKTGGPNIPVVLFNCASSRRAGVAQSLLPDFQGYLQTDDYAGYNKVAKTEGITQRKRSL